MTRSMMLLMVIYIIGVICVCAILAEMLIGGNKVINPEAMLPFTYFESGTVKLAMGAVPMCVVSYLLFMQFKNKKRFLLLIPGIITAVNFIYWSGIMAIGYINMLFHF